MPEATTTSEDTALIVLTCKTSPFYPCVYDERAEQFLVLGATAFGALETTKGFCYVLNGLLFDPSLRLIYRPHQHKIRDWQHTPAQGGVINTLIAVVVQAVIGA